MNAVYHAHSGLRYLVLLAALVALVVLVRGLTGGRPYDRTARIAAAAFTGLLHLQVLLGILLVVLGIWYPALMGHVTMMILAAAAAQILTVWGKKEADPKRGHTLSLAGVGVALLLILGGIAAIGRHPLESRAVQTSAAP